MYRLLSKAVLFLVPASLAFAQGTLIETSFYSPSMGQEKNLHIYLPEGYESQWWRHYPVIYYLHGAGQLIGHNDLDYLVPVLDDLIGSGDIWPVILVMPDGFAEPYPTAFYTSSVLYGDLEGYMTDDLVGWMDDNYRTIPWFRKRAVMGHSMGGYGAVLYYGKNPELFSCCAAVCGSGMDLPTMVSVNLTGVFGELPTFPYQYNPSAGFSNLVLFSMSGAFSPNLSNPPYYVDLPLDPYGNIIPSVYDLWMEHNLPRYLQWMTSDCWWWDETTIYFDAGTEDQFYTVPASNAFSDSLNAMGIDHEYQVFQGGHFDKLHERFPIALEFLCTAMHHRWGWWWDSRAASSPLPLEAGGVISSHGVQIGDQMNSETLFFELAEHSDVCVTVYDAAGRVASTPVNEALSPGAHRVNLDREHLATGVYFYAITAGLETVTGKLLVTN